MKILVLSGEVTHQRPMSYGLPHDWSVQVLELVDPEYLTLCEKYEEPKNISLPETMSFLRRAMQLAISNIQVHDYDAVVGVGYGAHVLTNMITAYEWRGPSVLIFSEGTTRLHFTTTPPLDEVDFDTRPVKTVRVTIGDKAKLHGGRMRRGRHELDKGVILQAHIFNHDWAHALYATGMLESLIKIVVQRH